MNPYRVLGVKKKSSKEEIHKAYKELAKKHHPDVGGDINKFQKIREAYDILKDDESRKFFDKTGTTPNSEQHEIIENVIGLFKSYLMDNVQHHGAINFSQIKKKVRRDINEASKMIIKARSDRDYLEGQVDAVKMIKKRRPNCYKAAHEMLMDEIESNIKNNEAKLKKLNKIVKMLENYKGKESKRMLGYFNEKPGYSISIVQKV